ncbi:MAG: ABC transporter permease [Paludibacter sp.]|nr:ABC transporter permease [Bacteroidales bacterium]MCM1069241.1 ABC transporter permease [Prevotella sp.]MCM1354339.1 ABC transporter permease [Bacteroides sp.]MCM1443201.1 ABC transporter permease [Muribaculum sp.]MCM1481796.1 ABC transporter permease [Paludibacter sp.]
MKTLIAVVRRELQQMQSRPIYLFSSVVVMIFSCVFFLTLMNEGIPQKLPIGIVDHDQTYISRMVRREIDAGQAVNVIAEYANYTEAREAMQRGEIYAFVELPANMYSDMLAMKRPTVAIYANNAYLLGGMLSYRQLMTIVNLASGAMQREVMRGRGMRDSDIMPLIQPVVIDTHMLGNPWANYPIYLATTILPGILGLMVLTLCAFAITHELKTGTSKEWLATAGNSIFVAVSGKMLPYTILFTLLGWLMNIAMFGILHFPMNGSLLFLCLSTLIYVIAMQAAAIVITSCVPVPRMAVCLCVLYGVLAFSLSGFTYPVESMKPAFQAWSYLVPLRYYYLITVDQMLMGLSAAKSCLWLALMGAAVILPIPLSHRLKNALLYRNFPED